MLQWFRRKLRNDEQAPAEAAAHTPTRPVVEEPAPAGTDPAKPRRRRGSRGGRGRGGAKTETAQRPERAEAKPAKPPAEKPERKPAAKTRRQSTRRRTPARRPPLPAAKRELLVSVDVGEQRVAVVEDDRVAEVYLERPERRSIAGNIYKGVVDNVLPGMEAAFVEIGLEKNGFLYVDEIVGPELEGRSHGRKIQDLISRGQEILVQAVKDPMKSKGARLTTEISLPGRFVVFVPYGEGLGVSRRLDDDERTRLRDILKGLKIKEGGVIVRTAAEGASAEDVERDLVFLQRLWKSIQDRAKSASAPSLVYQEAELPLRVTRDLFTEDFVRALVDHDLTYKRIVGYLKKTSPHMAERVVRYREKQPLFEASGVDAEIRSTLNRRVDLPSGGYLIFDYAEAFTVIDVNTGRFVGSRSKSSTARLEDTLTKNNLEAVKEVVHQLRLRDIGGIIVIDFIDMANPKNRALVEDALKKELERDRTKTYVVEISPLGLVEMTRQNVTEGPREILTRKCPACAGDGVVLSERSAAVDAERKLRELAASRPRVKAFRIALNAHVASTLIGPGAERLAEIEAAAKRRFLIEAREDVPVDHFEVLEQGTLEKLLPETPVEEGAELSVKLVEVGLHDAGAGIAKLDGYTVCVGGAANLVGKSVKVRVQRFLDGTAYATLAAAAPKQEPPITAEAAAEKPTRTTRARKPAAEADAPAAEVTEPADAGDVQEDEPVAETPDEPGAETPKKRTRRGSRGGRGRKRKAAEPTPVVADGEPVVDEAPGAEAPPDEPPPTPEAPKIHLPSPDLGRVDNGAPEASSDGAAPEQPKKKTRRGTRGGRNRKRKTPASTTADAAAADAASRA